MIQLFKPRDPQSNGMIQRNNIFPATVLSQTLLGTPHNLNAQMDSWGPISNPRLSCSRRAGPAEQLNQDRVAMRYLPPAFPGVLLRSTVRLPRDYFVRVHRND